METIAIYIQATPEMVEKIEELLKLAGANPEVRRNSLKDPGEFLSVKQAAEEAKMHYSAFRRQVVDKKRIKYSRPTGPKGNIKIRRADLVRFLESKNKPRRVGRKPSGISII